MERSIYRIYHDYDTEQEKKKYLGSVFFSILFFGIIGVLISIVFRNSIFKYFNEIDFYPILFNVILYSFLCTIVSFSQVVAQVKENAKQFIAISILTLVCTTLFNIYFIVYKNEGILGYTKGQLYGTLCMIPIVLVYIYRSISVSFIFEVLIKSLTFSIPFLPSLLGSWVTNLSDRLFIGHSYTQADVGIYSLAYKISGLVLFISGAIFSAYNPIFFKLANEKDTDINIKINLIYKYNKFILSLTFLIGIVLLSISDLALAIFFNKTYLVSYQFIPLLIYSFIINQLTGLFNLMIYQSKKTKYVIYSMVLTSLLNLLLNYYFLKQMGVIFAAFSTFLVILINFIFVYFIAKKSFFVNIAWSKFLLLTGSFLIIYFENRIIFDFNFLFKVILKFFTVLVIFIFFRRDFYKLFKFYKSKEVNS